MCNWVLSFLTGCTALLKIGNFSSNLFNIHNRTLQGLPLLSILSAFYTVPLLDLAKT